MKKLKCYLLLFYLLLLCNFHGNAVFATTGSGFNTIQLTGNQIEDLINTANANMGKNGPQLGYGYGTPCYNNWCAAFVTDCAELVGIPSSVIPRSTWTADGVYNYVINHGGKAVSKSEAKRGDLAIYDWHGGTNPEHIEIVYDVTDSGAIFTIGGNTGITSPLSVAIHTNSTSNIYKLVRPNYSPVTKDTEPPTIVEAYIKDVTATGYTVHCNLSDNYSLGTVQLPTWNSYANANGDDHDDITRYEIRASGTQWEHDYRVNISEHNNEQNCWYWTDIYCFDAAGNRADIIRRAVYIEPNKPTISSVYVSDITSTGYTVHCTVEDDFDLSLVKFGTWNSYTDNNKEDHDDLVWKEIVVNGKKREVVYKVDISEHNYERDCWYWTDIYCYDQCNNSAEIVRQAVKIESKFLNDPDKIIPDGVYMIKSAMNESFGLHVSQNSDYSGANVELGKMDQNNSFDQFTINYVSDGYYMIKSVGSGMALDIYGEGDGANLQQWTPNGSNHQLFRIYPSETESYYLVPQFDNSRCIDLVNGKVLEGNNIQLWREKNVISQEWTLECLHENVIEPDVTLKEEGSNLIAQVDSGMNYTAFGIVYSESSDVTLDTPGRTRVAFTELSSNGTFNFDASGISGYTFRAYVIYNNEAGEGVVAYSAPISL